MRFAWLLLLLGISGCTDGGESDTGEGDADTDADTDTEADIDPLPVVLSFTGQAVTVTGTPWGRPAEEIRNSVVTGTFTYDRNIGDFEYENPELGVYDHLVGTSGFEMTVAGHTITGSGRAITEVHDSATSDTWRFSDGPQFADPTERTMKVDGADDPSAELWVSLVAPGTFFTGDAQPESFPTPDFTGFDYPHTFSLDIGPDDGATSGGLLMQLDTLVQTSP